MSEQLLSGQLDGPGRPTAREEVHNARPVTAGLSGDVVVGDPQRSALFVERPAGPLELLRCVCHGGTCHGGQSNQFG